MPFDFSDCQHVEAQLGETPLVRMENLDVRIVPKGLHLVGIDVQGGVDLTGLDGLHHGVLVGE